MTRGNNFVSMTTYNTLVDIIITIIVNSVTALCLSCVFNSLLSFVVKFAFSLSMYRFWNINSFTNFNSSLWNCWKVKCTVTITITFTTFEIIKSESVRTVIGKYFVGYFFVPFCSRWINIYSSNCVCSFLSKSINKTLIQAYILSLACCSV